MKKPEEKRFSKYFKAIGDPSRLRIIYLLSGNELTVNEIAEKIGLSQSTISRHLAVLRNAEVAIDRREGQKVFYSLNKISIESCCSGFCDCLEIKMVNQKKPKKKK